jgi:transcriptional regulator with XRE-family HTH domain
MKRPRSQGAALYETPTDVSLVGRVGADIRCLRHDRGWTQEECAFRCNDLGPALLRTIESGRTNITVATLARLGDGLGWTPPSSSSPRPRSRSVRPDALASSGRLRGPCRRRSRGQGQSRLRGPLDVNYNSGERRSHRAPRHARRGHHVPPETLHARRSRGRSARCSTVAPAGVSAGRRQTRRPPSRQPRRRFAALGVSRPRVHGARDLRLALAAPEGTGARDGPPRSPSRAWRHPECLERGRLRAHPGAVGGRSPWP